MKCKADVWQSTGNWGNSRRCDRNASTPAGYCRTHDPDVVASRRRDRDGKKNKERAARTEPLRKAAEAVCEYAKNSGLDSPETAARVTEDFTLKCFFLSVRPDVAYRMATGRNIAEAE